MKFFDASISEVESDRMTSVELKEYAIKQL